MENDCSASDQLTWEVLFNAWTSPIVPRDQKSLDKFSGGLLSAKTLANRDAMSQGPRQRIKIGKKVAYPTKALIEWIRENGVIIEDK